jgi:competence ComEA-like helix-hairpin-helix protein
MDLTIVKNYGDRIQARYLALAGIEKAKGLLYQDAIDRKRAGKNHTGDLYDSSDNFRDITLGRGSFSVLRRARPEEGSGVVYGIADEQSRLNLNQADPEVIAKLYGMTPDIVAAITDWKDEDNNISPAGAEADYYMSLKPPYVPRNGPLLTVRELLMVRGVSRELLLGDDIKQNGMLDREETTQDSRAQATAFDPGLAEVLTVDGWTENVNAEGEDRVNIQNADENALSGVPGISKDIARAIVTSRDQNRLESIADLLEVAAPQNQNQNRNRGGPGDATNPDQAQNTGPLVINEDRLLEIADSLTADNTREQPGLININTASAQVFACLPGSSAELAQAMVSFRASNGFFPNIASILKVPGMSRDSFKQMAKYLTARSETFRITAEGKVTSSGARQRIQVVIHVGAYDVQTLAYREDL